MKQGNIFQKRATALVLLTGLLLLAAVGVGAALEVPAKDAGKCEGQDVTVCGVIASVFFPEDLSQSAFINLDQPYPNDPFVVRILPQYRSKFDPAPYQVGTFIAVTGNVGLSSSLRGVPHIKVTGLEQIAIRRPAGAVK